MGHRKTLTLSIILILITFIPVSTFSQQLFTKNKLTLDTLYRPPDGYNRISFYGLSDDKVLIALCVYNDVPGEYQNEATAIYIYNHINGDQIAKFKTNFYEIIELTFSPDNKYLMVNYHNGRTYDIRTDNFIAVYDLNQQKLIENTKIKSDFTKFQWSSYFNRNNEIILIPIHYKNVKAKRFKIDGEKLIKLKTPKFQKKGHISLLFNSHGNFYIHCFRDESLKLYIYDIDGNVIRKHYPINDRVFDFISSSDYYGYIESGSGKYRNKKDSRKLVLWSTKTHERLNDVYFKEPKDKSLYYPVLANYKNNTYIIFEDIQGNVAMYHIRNPYPIFELKKDNGLSFYQFRPDSRANIINLSDMVLSYRTWNLVTLNEQALDYFIAETKNGRQKMKVESLSANNNELNNIIQPKNNKQNNYIELKLEDFIGNYIDNKDTYTLSKEGGRFYFEIINSFGSKKLIISPRKTGDQYESELIYSDFMWDIIFKRSASNKPELDISCNLWDGNRIVIKKSATTTTTNYNHPNNSKQNQLKSFAGRYMFEKWDCFVKDKNGSLYFSYSNDSENDFHLLTKIKSPNSNKYQYEASWADSRGMGIFIKIGFAIEGENTIMYEEYFSRGQGYEKVYFKDKNQSGSEKKYFNITFINNTPSIGIEFKVEYAKNREIFFGNGKHTDYNIPKGEYKVKYRCLGDGDTGWYKYKSGTLILYSDKEIDILEDLINVKSISSSDYLH